MGQKNLRVFISYARVDDILRKELDKHLSQLKQQGLISVWDDRDISAGTEWKREIDMRLNTAHIILLLISPDFMASEYCSSTEMKRALERQRAREAHVIPILLRHVEWETAPFSHLQVLPQNAVPVTDRAWHTLDEAFFDVATGIRKVVEKLMQAEQTERESIPHKEQRKSTSTPPGTLLLRYTGHSRDVLALAWSSNGKRIASGSSDKTVQVWNPGEGIHIFTHKGHVDYVKSVAWSPDSKRIASTSKDGTVQVWSPDDREEFFTFIASGPVVWSPDGKRIASASRDGTVQVWNADRSGQPFTYQGHFTLLNPLGRTHSVAWAWSPDSRRIASAYEDGTVQIWNADGSGQPFTYKGHFNWLASYRIGSLTWSPDGKRIASAFIDKTVQVWNPDGRMHIFTYRGHVDYVKSVAWSPNGKRIASTSKDGTVRVWNPDTGEESLTFTASGPVVWSPDGKRIASTSRDGTVQVWNPDDKEQSFTFIASGPVVWSPDGKRIASGSSDSTVRIWSVG